MPTNRTRRRVIWLTRVSGRALTVALAASFAVTGQNAMASSSTGVAPLVDTGGDAVVPGRYIVVLRTKSAGSLAASPAATVAQRWRT
jgi:hypothetical protein